MDFPAGVACADFDLRIEVAGGKLHTTEFVDADDQVVRTIAAGTGGALTFINMSTNASMSLKSNGGVNQTIYGSNGTKTVQLTGHNIVIMFPTDIPAGPSTMISLRGRHRPCWDEAPTPPQPSRASHRTERPCVPDEQRDRSSTAGHRRPP